jgi:hypothetical protein
VAIQTSQKCLELFCSTKHVFVHDLLICSTKYVYQTLIRNSKQCQHCIPFSFSLNLWKNIRCLLQPTFSLASSQGYNYVIQIVKWIDTTRSIKCSHPPIDNKFKHCWTRARLHVRWNSIVYFEFNSEARSRL